MPDVSIGSVTVSNDDGEVVLTCDVEPDGTLVNITVPKRKRVRVPKKEKNWPVYSDEDKTANQLLRSYLTPHQRGNWTKRGWCTFYADTGAKWRLSHNSALRWMTKEDSAKRFNRWWTQYYGRKPDKEYKRRYGAGARCYWCSSTRAHWCGGFCFYFEGFYFEGDNDLPWADKTLAVMLTIQADERSFMDLRR